MNMSKKLKAMLLTAAVVCIMVMAILLIIYYPIVIFVSTLCALFVGFVRFLYRGFFDMME
jgi:hypothetical protein